MPFDVQFLAFMDWNKKDPVRAFQNPPFMPIMRQDCETQGAKMQLLDNKGALLWKLYPCFYEIHSESSSQVGSLGWCRSMNR